MRTPLMWRRRARPLRRPGGAALQKLESGLGSRLLRLFLALAPSLSERPSPGVDGGNKHLGVIWAYLVSDPIPWKPALALLQQLLQ